MGRGRSKAGGAGRTGGTGGGGGGAVSTFGQIIPIGEGASFNTAQSVVVIESMRGEGGSRSRIRDELEKIREGQKISTFTEGYSNGGATPGVAENLVSWEKMDDGTWRGSNGQRLENSEMTRKIYNGSGRFTVGAGELTTESHVNITGKESRPLGGLRYAEGTYDIQVGGNSLGQRGPRKLERSGRLTTINGTQYGVTRDGGEYTVTHIPTGISVGTSKAKNLTELSGFIIAVDKRVADVRGLKDMEDRFKNTLRGD